MTISKNRNDREFQKFREGNDGLPVVGVIPFSGTDINPLAKFVEATYSNENKTVTYTYYESSLKATQYNSITTVYTVPQDTTFTSAEWS